MRTRWHVAPGALHAVERDMERGLLTARGLDRVLRVAWTLADLAGHDRPGPEHVLEALQLRTGVSRGVPARREARDGAGAAAPRTDRRAASGPAGRPGQSGAAGHRARVR